MLTESERKILELISKQLLITKPELQRKLRGDDSNNGVDAPLRRLVEMGYIENVESLGTCLVLTQRGSRALKEL